MLEKLPAVVASGFVLVFIADLIGNYIHFKSKIGNALVTSIIWGILFVALDLLYSAYNPPPLLTNEHLMAATAAGVLLAFVSDLIGNFWLFDRRFANAFLTSVIWAVLFAIVGYLWWGGYFYEA